MSELTPERIRDAAEVLDALSDQQGLPFAAHTWSALAVRDYADRLERLAREVWTARELWVRGDGRTSGFDPLSPSVLWAFHVARDLINRYPALTERNREDHPQ